MDEEPLEEIVDDETKIIPVITDLPYCLAKKFEVRMIERGVQMRVDACTNDCDGRDTECLYWIAQYGIDGKGWKEGGDE